jgi:hypothetical protein
MAEQQQKPIAESTSVSDITEGVSSLIIETSELPDSASQVQHARLVLLQPLANADTLETCRNPNSRFIRNTEGAIVRPSNFEYLNIQRLNAAWRQAVKNATPFPQVTFDLTLPKEESGSAFQKVYWDISIPQEGGFAVRTQDVMTMVITLATGIKMRKVMYGSRLLMIRRSELQVIHWIS